MGLIHVKRGNKKVNRGERELVLSAVLLGAQQTRACLAVKRELQRIGLQHFATVMLLGYYYCYFPTVCKWNHDVHDGFVKKSFGKCCHGTGWLACQWQRASRQ